MFWIIGIVSVVVLLVLIFVAWPVFQRWLADNGWFWVRVPEMHAVVIMQDRNLHKIIIASSDNKKNSRLQKELGDLIKEDKVGICQTGQLFWIGVPWKFQLYSWYEYSADDVNPEVDPQYALDLRERIWDYSADNDVDGAEHFNEEWGVDTADPIQVTPKLAVFVEVENPQAALFGVTYFQEGIQREVLTAWKKAVEGLHYFSYERGGADPSGVSKDLQTQAQQKMNTILGLPANGIYEISDSDKSSRNSIAKRIYSDFGIWLKKVEVRDIDPTDSAIRGNLNQRLTAQTEAAATMERAKGVKQATITTAEGEAQAISMKGQAEADVVRMALEQKAKGLAEMMKASGIPKKQAAPLIVNSEAFLRAMAQVENISMVGDPVALVMSAFDKFRREA